MEKPLYRISLEKVYAKFTAATAEKQREMLDEMLEHSENADNEQSKRFWRELHDWLKREAGE